MWQQVDKRGSRKRRKPGNVSKDEAHHQNGDLSRRNVFTKAPIASSRPSKAIQSKMDNIKKSADEFLKKQAVALRSDDSAFSEEEEEDNEMQNEKLLELTLKQYKQLVQDTGGLPGGAGDVSVMVEKLNSSNLGADTTCLICLSSIKRLQPIWNCSQCFCSFHLECIQQWVTDGSKIQSLLSVELFPDQEVTWSCPKCRHDYPHSSCPRSYYCYCGKVQNPPDDPWLLSHSCGKPCDRPLLPLCGHRCVSLCHPGPCLPCPRTVSVRCYCGRGDDIMRRCGSKGWSCGRVCRKVLSCDQHVCESICHEGSCPECQYTVQQPCRCGKHVEDKLCKDLDWQCKEKCGRPLSCGHHYCEKVCHHGNCGMCPRSGERKCPCQKTTHVLPCTQDVPTCGDTCGKLLACGIHRCVRQCHYGTCGQCMERVTKSCRCGRKTKETSCGSEYLCDTKCNNMKQCLRHNCRRKCCDGRCPPCEVTCGRSLACGHHKCTAPCHTGQCYPCTATLSLSCSCGKTKRHILCVQRRRIKPPVCRELCLNPPKCHHPHREPHRCHGGRCPPCRMVCGLSLDCGHACTSTCHTEPHQVAQTDEIPFDATVSWEIMKKLIEEQKEKERQLVVDPCPPCMVPVPQACVGQHEVIEVPCSLAQPYSCKAACGRELPCSNHTCAKMCHQVVDPPDEIKAGKNCSECKMDCLKARLLGCAHACNLPCHPGPCPSCTKPVMMRCHCKAIPIVIPCNEWTSTTNEQDKMALLSCSSHCPKLITCGHPCSYNCHGGDCSPVDQCMHKVTLKCPCGRKKKKCCCHVAKSSELCCDEKCDMLVREKEMEKQQQQLMKGTKHGDDEVKLKREEAARRREDKAALRREELARRREERAQFEDEQREKIKRDKRRKMAALILIVILLIMAMIYMLMIIYID